MEVLSYHSKPVLSDGEDLWKATTTKKEKPVFERQDVSYQPIETIVQFFTSNYVAPPPKKRR